MTVGIQEDDQQQYEHRRWNKPEISVVFNNNLVPYIKILMIPRKDVPTTEKKRNFKQLNHNKTAM